MDISFVTNAGNLSLTNGFGVAGYNLVTSLQRLGHAVRFADENSPVEIAFCQPDYSEWSNKDAYHIQYTPWESNELPQGWVEAFNDNCDEVWTPSPLIAKWYAEAGVTKPIFVYEHGIENIWTPVRRRRGDKLRFLHVGEPAPRKGGQMTMEAFHEVFGDRKDVSLTIKAYNRSSIRVMKNGSSLGVPQSVYKNITTVYDEYTPEQMVNLFHHHDALVYPGYGEGFGLIPLQALATGMPTICTEAWAPYKQFLEPTLALSSTLGASPWPHIHTGQMFHPSYDDLKRSLQGIDDNYETHAGRAYRTAFKVHEHYDWDRLTEEAFSRIVTKFS